MLLLQEVIKSIWLLRNLLGVEGKLLLAAILSLNGGTLIRNKYKRSVPPLVKREEEHKPGEGNPRLHHFILSYSAGIKENKRDNSPH